VIATIAAESACLIGGNLSRSPGPLIVDVTAIGSVRRRRVLTRAGGRAGDELYVTGSVGGAAVGLAVLTAGLDRGGLDDALRECVDRHERPVARVRLGRAVAAHRAATAAIDLSDGLAGGVTQLAEASGTGATIDAAAIPVALGARAWHAGTGADPILAALTGGEDYELLFAVPPRRRRAFLAAVARAGRLACTKVGQLTKEPGAWLEYGARRERVPEGFTHYTK
jgi:thiamine-monophosphate kinase